MTVTPAVIVVAVIEGTVGCRAGVRPSILDVTAGHGLRDPIEPSQSSGKGRLVPIRHHRHFKSFKQVGPILLGQTLEADKGAEERWKLA